MAHQQSSVAEALIRWRVVAFLAVMRSERLSDQEIRHVSAQLERGLSLVTIYDEVRRTQQAGPRDHKALANGKRIGSTNVDNRVTNEDEDAGSPLVRLTRLIRRLILRFQKDFGFR